LRVDGGATQSEPLMQIQADLLQTTVVRPQETETTALGAAYLAGLGMGFWGSRSEISGNWKVDTIYQPQRSADALAPLKRNWARAVERAKGWQAAEEQ
jgi:glycerol kinase